MHAFIKQLKFHPYEKNHPDQHPYATGILCTGIPRYTDIMIAVTMLQNVSSGRYTRPDEYTMALIKSN